MASPTFAERSADLGGALPRPVHTIRSAEPEPMDPETLRISRVRDAVAMHRQFIEQIFGGGIDMAPLGATIQQPGETTLAPVEVSEYAQYIFESVWTDAETSRLLVVQHGFRTTSTSETWAGPKSVRIWAARVEDGKLVLSDEKASSVLTGDERDALVKVVASDQWALAESDKVREVVAAAMGPKALSAGFLAPFQQLTLI